MATQKKFFADTGLETSSSLQVDGNATIDGNTTITGNLTVNGTSLTVNATTTSVEDNLFELANSNTAADTLDIGIYGNYDDGLSDGGASEYTGLFRDASDSTWKLFDGLEETPTTTINTSGTGFGLADLQVGDLTATTLTATNGLTGSSITYPTSDGTSGQAIITDGSGGLSFGTVSASTDGIITSGTTTIIQSQDDTNVIHVNNSAEVQIGTTTSNNRKFTVKGSGDLMQLRSTNSGAGGAQLDLIHESSSPADGDNVGIINFSDNTKQYASVKGIASNTGASGELHLGVRTDGSNYNATAVVIDNSGDVLIGQTSQTGYAFAQKLVVGDGDDNEGITIQSGPTGQGNLAFNHSDGTTAHGRISYQHNTNYMQFFTNNTERVRIDTLGHVGIGQATPKSGLDVYGAVAIAEGDTDLGTHTYGAYASRAGSGCIQFTAGYSGTLVAGRTFVFKYAATSWKAYHGTMTIASTQGFSKHHFGGYWNNSGGSDVDSYNGAAATCAISFDGQAVIVTLTLTAGCTHPMVSVEYHQSGGDGAPRMDKAELYIQ